MPRLWLKSPAMSAWVSLVHFFSIPHPKLSLLFLLFLLPPSLPLVFIALVHVAPWMLVQQVLRVRCLDQDLSILYYGCPTHPSQAGPAIYICNSHAPTSYR